MTKRRFPRASDIPQVAGRTPLEAAIVGALEAVRSTPTPTTQKQRVSETLVLDFEDAVVVDLDDIES